MHTLTIYFLWTVNFPPHFWELFPFASFNSDNSVATITEGCLNFRLQKKEQLNWNKLEAPFSDDKAICRWVFARNAWSYNMSLLHHIFPLLHPRHSSSTSPIPPLLPSYLYSPHHFSSTPPFLLYSPTIPNQRKASFRLGELFSTRGREAEKVRHGKTRT